LKKKGLWKKAVTGTILMALFLSAGCDKKEDKAKSSESAASTEAVTETDTETTAESGTETVTEDASTEEATTEAATTANGTPYMKLEDGRSVAPTSDDAIWDLLHGTWEFYPYGYSAAKEDAVEITFDRDEKNAIMMRYSDYHYVSGKVVMKKTYDGLMGSDMFTYTVDDMSSGFTSNEEVKGSSTDFQFMLGSGNGVDYLVLRQLGNGDSPLVTESFLHDTTAWDGFWLFMRYTETEETDYQMEDDRLKAASFDAFVWKNNGDSYELQPVFSEAKEEEWYDGTAVAVHWSLADIVDPYRITTYWLKDGEFFGHPGTLMPGLASVTVDEKGEITSLVPLEYLGYGMYRIGFSAAEEDSDYRSPSVYQEHDNFYTGSWSEMGQFGGDMEIRVASPEVGGYKISITKMFESEQTVYISADAHIEGGDLVIHSGDVKVDDGEAKYGLTGIIRLCDVGAEFEVFESPEPALMNGAKFTFAKKSE